MWAIFEDLPPFQNDTQKSPWHVKVCVALISVRCGLSALPVEADKYATNKCTKYTYELL